MWAVKDNMDPSEVVSFVKWFLKTSTDSFKYVYTFLLAVLGKESWSGAGDIKEVSLSRHWQKLTENKVLTEKQEGGAKGQLNYTKLDL